MSKIVGWILLVVLSAVVWAWVWDWYHPPQDRTVYRYNPAPYTAPRSPILGKVAPTPQCVPTVVYKPTSHEAARIEEKLGGELVPGSLLTLRDVKPMPYGGRIAVVAPPPTPENPNPEVVTQVFPKKAPFLEWFPSREVSVGYGVGGSGSLRQAWLAEFRQDLVRVGPVLLGGRLGIQGFQGDTSRGYALLTASVKF